MGNHEYNAIAYFTKNTQGEYLRPHNAKNLKQHKDFIKAYQGDSDEYKAVIEWFKTLPLWLEFDDFRVVHACWDEKSIDLIQDFQNDSNILSDELLYESSKQGTWQHSAVEMLLKGRKISMPDEYLFDDIDGNTRKQMRIKWWKGIGSSYQDCFIGASTIKALLPVGEINSKHLVEYKPCEKLLFIGHYALRNKIKVLTPNIVCLDYGVAYAGGTLAAYCLNDVKADNKKSFVSVKRP